MLGLWRATCYRPSKAVAPLARPWTIQNRSLLTLAIETSCDDTSVALLEKHQGALSDDRSRAELHFHEKVTSDNRQFQGVSPIAALESHQENLASLVQRATARYSSRNGEPLLPDFISVTRGPGMRSSVSTGLDTAKGLAVAYGVPLVGVNHMQAHALTPRLVSALNGSVDAAKPEFPFLTLLVSGGHTMLLNSESLLSHRILASTTDVALGDALDKMARQILPERIIDSCQDVSYARELESFVVAPTVSQDQKPEWPITKIYNPPASRQDEIQRKKTRWGWSLPVPLAETRGGQKAFHMDFSFSGLDSAVNRIIAQRKSDAGAEGISDTERAHMGVEVMRISFEHLASRIVLALDSLKSQSTTKVKTIVVSGGVAANKYLREVLERYIKSKGYPYVQLNFPPIEFCTDNAAMIAWAGIEMYEAGWQSNLNIRPLRKWSLDSNAPDGGIIGVGGWCERAV